MKLHSHLINVHHIIDFRKSAFNNYRGTLLHLYPRKECRLVGITTEPEISKVFRQKYPNYKSSEGKILINLLTQNKFIYMERYK